MRRFGPDSPWQFAPGLTFLNHGSFGACPVPVLAAQRALSDELEASPIAFLDVSLEARLDGVRDVLAAFLHADPAGIVFLPNATTGVSTVLQSLSFEPGDELLTTNHEYNATLNAVTAVARRARAEVVVARLPMEIESDEQALEAILASVTARTRLALVGHITSPTATICRSARSCGPSMSAASTRWSTAPTRLARCPSTSAHSAPPTGTGNGHKWLCGPKVSAVLHVREDRRAAIRPLIISHGWNDSRPDRSRFWKEFDWTGTWDPTPTLVLPDAIQMVGGLHPDGWPGIMAANHDLAIEGRARVAAALGVTPRIPAALHGSMALVRLPMPASDEAARALKASLVGDDHIEVPVVTFPVPAGRPGGAGDAPTDIAVRISAQRYNDLADYDRLAEALARRRA